MVSAKKSLDSLFALIQVGNNGFCIVMRWSCKYIDFEMTGHFLQEGKAVWTNIKIYTLFFWLLLYTNLPLLVALSSMDKRLIKIQDKELLFAFYV